MNRLSISALLAKSPYIVTEIENGTFIFETDNEVLYKVQFEEDFPIGDCETYQFYITNVHHAHAKFDIKIKYTILAILDEFFKANGAVVLYVCDTGDGRQKGRSLLFYRWFNEADIRERFTILTGMIVDEDIENYFGILIEKNNPKYQQVVDDFNNTFASLSTDK